MLIERIIYTNLDRRPDRNEWFLKNMAAAGVPMDIVERFPAKDWRDYESYEGMIKTIQKDGIGVNIRRLQPQWMWGHCAYVWTQSIVLKRIVDDNKITLVMHDDCYIKSWEMLTKALKPFENFVNKHNRHWDVIQLFSYNEEPTLGKKIKFSKHFGYGTRRWGDIANIYTSFGADKVNVLIRQTSSPLISTEQVLFQHFINWNSFHVRGDMETFIQNGGDKFSSDIHSRDNPEMLMRNE